MGVNEWLVLVPVGVRLPGWITLAMRVLMMFVVNVSVFVLQRFGGVLVFVALDEVEPKAHAHQHGGCNEPTRNRFSKQR